MFSVKIASLMAKNHESRQFCEKLNIKKKKKKKKKFTLASLTFMWDDTAVLYSIF